MIALHPHDYRSCIPTVTVSTYIMYLGNRRVIFIYKYISDMTSQYMRNLKKKEKDSASCIW